MKRYQPGRRLHEVRAEGCGFVQLPVIFPNPKPPNPRPLNPRPVCAGTALVCAALLADTQPSGCSWLRSWLGSHGFLSVSNRVLPALSVEAGDVCGESPACWPHIDRLFGLKSGIEAGKRPGPRMGAAL